MRKYANSIFNLVMCCCRMFFSRACCMARYFELHCALCHASDMSCNAICPGVKDKTRFFSLRFDETQN